MRANLRVIGLKDTNVKLKGKERQVYSAAYKGLANAALRILSGAKVLLKNDGSIATGQLRDSGVVERNEGYVDVEFRAEHAAYVEFGRKPGSRPPAKPLESWVIKKGLADSYSASGSRRTRGGDFMSKVRSIAFAIAKSIGRKGIKAKPFLYPSFRQNERHIISAVSQAIRKVL